MDNVQLQKSFISKPSSLTFKSYLSTVLNETKYTVNSVLLIQIQRLPTAETIRLKFEVLTAVFMKSSVCWDITPCSLLTSGWFPAWYTLQV
jgi:hypothetical protein